MKQNGQTMSLMILTLTAVAAIAATVTLFMIVVDSFEFIGTKESNKGMIFPMMIKMKGSLQVQVHLLLALVRMGSFDVVLKEGLLCRKHCRVVPRASYLIQKVLLSWYHQKLRARVTLVTRYSSGRADERVPLMSKSKQQRDNCQLSTLNDV